MLVGIVVNNAILIIDYALQQMKSCGESIEVCIHQASVVKFRAVLMTNIAIIAGILPQVFGGTGSGFLIPLAAATMGGVAVSTIFTLFTIPSLFLIVERVSRALRNAYNKIIDGLMVDINKSGPDGPGPEDTTVKKPDDEKSPLNKFFQPFTNDRLSDKEGGHFFMWFPAPFAHKQIIMAEFINL